MKRLTLVLAGLIIASLSFAEKSKTEGLTFNVDTDASKIYWTGKKVSGEHTGHLMIDEGKVFVKGDKVTGAELSMDLNTIDCTDLSGEWKDKLVGHLKSDDFFSAEKFPHAKFRITSVKHEKDDKKVTGDLTIKGITHEISFPAEIKVVNDEVSAIGTASIDRTKWDIKYGSGKFFQGLGDNLIRDEFEIRFELKAGANKRLTDN